MASLLAESEALEALGWLWNTADQSTSHGNRVGICCNEAGNVTSISYSMYSDYYEVNMDELNLPSFQNPESLNLDGCGLKGIIPYEIEGFASLIERPRTGLQRKKERPGEGGVGQSFGEDVF
ncbi:hypothetical protein LguiA_029325 [Lonicera macranthoides]